ncbi:EGF domain-specific O-linked N-acetylglucosamine transferase-like [Saccoglossus kowalevskii]|uniref:EGF domain-specific O-linked N-acetylglucosamine transferase n=1 Tax=Saccoglossus kowalevskii TaxID=10224 RepID=A0ABM0MR11_SACKO|nr:PREDICTED: EGF domain-specific O-linked N-acetylglucosamine transferase-like isoform X1 [Saccoglossus kowalevskii]
MMRGVCLWKIVILHLILVLIVDCGLSGCTGDEFDHLGKSHQDFLQEHIEDKVRKRPDIKFIDPNLHPEHYQYYFTNNPEIAEICRLNTSCPYKDSLDSGKCWGYEEGCSKDQMLNYPICDKLHEAWATTLEEQAKEFFRIADFGYVKEMHDTMQTFCIPQNKGDSSLECTQYLRHCRGHNIYFDFSNLNSGNSRQRFRNDIFHEGEIGGHCQLKVDELKAESAHNSELQSWYAELNSFTSFDFQIPNTKDCDIIINKPTYFMKLDAGINMYHHFCDFVNIYISQHINNSFSSDVNIVMWDTSGLSYGDFFSATWQAFSDYPIIPIKRWDGKKVCMKEAVFSLLPRMQRGFYYNMPLVPSCHGSGIIKAFSQHLMHRLKIPQEGPLKNKVRVTLLARNTKHRNIINQNELVKAMKKEKDLTVKVVEYNRNMPFLKQLKYTHNSDIFIGMHGAGLTHSLFLPDWAVVFELYNCEDPRCYRDLANLRGIKYVTWIRVNKLKKHNETNHPSLGYPHAKFTDYEFDVKEFMKIVRHAADYVKQHPKYKEHNNEIIKDEL